MSPFSVTLEHIPDRDLGPLLARLAEAGFASPIIRHSGADARSERLDVPARVVSTDLPDDWRVLQLAYAFEQATGHGKKRPALISG